MEITERINKFIYDVEEEAFELEINGFLISVATDELEKAHFLYHNDLNLSPDLERRSKLFSSIRRMMETYFYDDGIFNVHFMYDYEFSKSPIALESQERSRKEALYRENISKFIVDMKKEALKRGIEDFEIKVEIDDFDRRCYFLLRES